MKELAGLDGRKLNTLMNKGHGLSYFLETYQCSEDELRDGLKKITKNPNDIDNIIRKMKKNDKQIKKKSSIVFNNAPEQVKYKSVQSDQMKAPNPYNCVNVPNLLEKAEKSIRSFEDGRNAQPTICESVIPNDFTNNFVNAETGSNRSNDVKKGEKKAEETTSETNKPTAAEAVVGSDNENELTKLNEDLMDTNHQIEELESLKESLEAEKTKNSKHINEIVEVIERLFNSLNIQKNKFEQICADVKECEEKSNNVNYELKQLYQKKAMISARICELSFITVYCEETDNSDNSFDYTVGQFDLTDATVTEKITSFFKGELGPLLDDFTVLDLKRVARIILAAEEIERENKSCKVELCFNNKSNLTGLLELMGRTVKIIKDN